MAVQAAFQKASKANLTIVDDTRYDLREISVSRSIVITSSSEVETSITLRLFSDNTRGFPGSWDEFRISSWQEGKDWTENCRGLINVRQSEAKSNLIDGKHHIHDTKAAYESIKDDMQRKCNTLIDIQKSYHDLHDLGFEYGPSFQNVCEAYACYGSCRGVVKIPETAKTIPYDHESESIIHPAFLDSCMHALSFALKGGGIDSSGVFVPTFMETLSISQGPRRKPGDRHNIYVTAKHDLSETKVNCSMLVFDGTVPSKSPMIEIKGFVGSRLHNSHSSDPESRGLCFRTEWEPHIDTLRKDQYSKILPLKYETDRERMQAAYAERAAFHCIQQYFATKPVNDQILQPHQQRLQRALCHSIEQGSRGLLPYQTEDWLLCSKTERDEFLHDVRSHDDCIEVICRMGEELPLIMRQETDALSIMIGENLLDRFYRSMSSIKYGHQICSHFASKLAHQNPYIKILEVGAGTGNATLPILSALGGQNGKKARFLSYTFTDVSAGFFGNAQEHLKAWGKLIQYGKLDIEQDPVEQGYEAKSYDVVVAANVLHVAVDIGHALRNVKLLLRPGGKLILLESTAFRLYTTITFGPLQGT